jgi:hypothetical protein
MMLLSEEKKASKMSGNESNKQFNRTKTIDSRSHIISFSLLMSALGSQ